jgi:biofilm PGA synthesis N-glycosyltransferase PgaC
MDERMKSRIAVLIPAHNEEGNLPSSLFSAVMQVSPEDVYVVDDNSSDDTVRTALKYTPNVYSTARGGKGAAVMAGVEHFFLLDRYEGVLVLDADSQLMPGSMSRYDDELKEGIAAVIGSLRVLEYQKGPIAAWRRHQYFYQVAVYLRGQAAFGGGMPVTPGFCTVYSTEALRNFELDPTAPTEDIDFCWQMHRKRLGKIVYAPRALVETGVPVNLSDYLKQIKRWHRGWHYATRKYRMPFGIQWVDLVAGLMTIEMALVWIRFALLSLLLIVGFMFNIHLTVFGYDALTVVAVSFLFDAGWIVALGLVSALARWKNKIVFWIALFPFFFLFDQLVNLCAAVTVKRGRNAIWTPLSRAVENPK